MMRMCDDVVMVVLMVHNREIPRFSCPLRSSMGNQRGFLGKSLLAFVILCCLVRAWRPAVFIHECTRLFRWKVFKEEDLLDGYVCHSTMVNPTEFGFPINRSRAYSAIVRKDWSLAKGLDQLFRLHISPALDPSCFFSANGDEARGREKGAGRGTNVDHMQTMNP